MIVVAGPWMLGQLVDYTDEPLRARSRRWSGGSMTANELLAQFGEQQVAGFILVLARIAPLFVLAPLFSLEDDPARACAAIVAVGLAVGLTPVAHARPARSRSTRSRFAGLVVKELLVGLAFALRARGAVRRGLQAAGSLLDTLIGFSFGALVDPITGNQSAVLAAALRAGRRR